MILKDKHIMKLDETKFIGSSPTRLTVDVYRYLVHVTMGGRRS